MVPPSSCLKVPSFIISNSPIEDDDQTELTLPVELRGAHLILDDDDEVMLPVPATRIRQQRSSRRADRQLQPSSSSAQLPKQKFLDPSSRCHSDQILVDTECLVELKLQLASQLSRVDILTSKLNLCQVENEALKAENDELQDTYSDDHLISTLDQSTSSEQEQGGWLSRSFRSNNTSNKNGLGGIFSNNNESKLVKENNRLHMSVENIRKSFQNYINSSRRNSRNDMAAMGKLQKENDELRRQLEDSKKAKPSLKVPLKEASPLSPPQYTVKTSYESDDVLGHLEPQDVPATSAHNFLQIPSQGGRLSDAWIIEGVDIEA